jgi:hypothetical protein
VAYANSMDEKVEWISAIQKAQSTLLPIQSYPEKSYNRYIYSLRQNLVNFKDTDRRCNCDECDQGFLPSQLKYRCHVSKSLIHGDTEACCKVYDKIEGRHNVNYRIGRKQADELEGGKVDEVLYDNYERRKFNQLCCELKGAKLDDKITRRFIREGPLLRVSKNSSAPAQLLHFTLFSDALFFSSCDNGVAVTQWLGQLALYSISVDDKVSLSSSTEETSGKTCAFSLSIYGKLSMILICPDLLIMECWVRDICEASTKLIASTSGGGPKSPPLESMRRKSSSSIRLLLSPTGGGAVSPENKWELHSNTTANSSTTAPTKSTSPLSTSTSGNKVSSPGKSFEVPTLNMRKSVDMSKAIKSPSATDISSSTKGAKSPGGDNVNKSSWRMTMKGMSSLFQSAKERRSSEVIFFLVRILFVHSYFIFV